MFLVKTNEIHLYVMLAWKGSKGEIWNWGGGIDEAESFLIISPLRCYNVYKKASSWAH